MLHIPEDPVHPGRILFDDFLEDYGLAIGKVAADTGIATDDLSAIRDGKAGITAEIVLQLSRYFSNSPEFWLNLQRAYDLSLAQKKRRQVWIVSSLFTRHSFGSCLTTSPLMRPPQTS